MTGIVIVSPSLSDANNGNWQTARRWQRFLASRARTRIVRAWPDDNADDDSIMVALHARRSAPSIAAWRARHPAGGLAVVLTGTDLYRDIQVDSDARRSLELADRLVVLQDCGPAALASDLRPRTRVIYQSAAARRRPDKPAGHLRALMVGHLREEKSPQTLYDAARLLGAQAGILIDHVGNALDARLGDAARETMAACPAYRWLGGLAHEATRRRIQRAHLLVHASRIEGGAHVVLEAVRSGTPVLASRIDGNVGMLGAGYDGYFEPGDAAGLAALLVQCRETQQSPDGLLARLARQCGVRVPLFEPAAERAALHALVDELCGNVRGRAQPARVKPG